MGDLITITVPGAARGKARPRLGKGGHVFTPKETVNAEAFVKSCAVTAMAGRPPIDGPVELRLAAVLEIPASWSKRKQADALSGVVRPTGRPDLDNVAKLFTDALNGIAYRDDKQIVRLSLEKAYGPNACTTVTLAQIDGAQAA